MTKIGDHVILVILFSIAIPSDSFSDDVALDLNLSTPGQTYPAPNSNHGWHFTVNSTITLTHLGLLDTTSGDDLTPNGFIDPHDVGLFLADGTLLTSGSFSKGTGNTIVVDNFRYVAVSPVSLNPLTDYVVAYHTGPTPLASEDGIIAHQVPFEMHPLINYVTARWGGDYVLAIPPNTTDYRFGPNFLFQVPEPNCLLLLAIITLAASAHRGR